MNNTWTAPAQRIVSLLPSSTEIVYALGLGDRLVGVTHECDFPPSARTLPQLTASALPHASSSAEIDRHVRKSLHEGSSLYSLDSELLERLAPDLIITQELCAVCAVSYEIVARAAKRLRGDPRIVSLEPSSLEDVYANIATVAEIAGAEQAAGALVAELRARIEKLGLAVAALPRPRTLVLEWTDPPMSGGHWTPGLVELAGGTPVFGASRSEFTGSRLGCDRGSRSRRRDRRAVRLRSARDAGGNRRARGAPGVARAARRA